MFSDEESESGQSIPSIEEVFEVRSSPSVIDMTRDDPFGVFGSDSDDDDDDDDDDAIVLSEARYVARPQSAPSRHGSQRSLSRRGSRRLDDYFDVFNDSDSDDFFFGNSDSQSGEELYRRQVDSDEGEGEFDERSSEIELEGFESDDSFAQALTGSRPTSARSRRSRASSGSRPGVRRQSRARSASTPAAPSPAHEGMYLGRTSSARGRGQGRSTRRSSDARVARCIQNEQDAPALDRFNNATREMVEESKREDILNHADEFGTQRFIHRLNQSLLNEGFELKDYQRTAANWMFTLYKLSLLHGNNPLYQLTADHPSGPYGACLGDSVGTGKTIQTVVTLDLIRNHINKIKQNHHVENDVAKILIVTPSVPHTMVWNQELQRVFSAGNGFSNTTIQQVYKAEISQESAEAQLEALNRHQRTVYICTYSLFQTGSHNYKQMREVMKRFRWACIVVDEAHEMRNGAKLYEELKQFTSDFRIALTATPIANKPENMICLFNFVVPGAIKNDVNDPAATRQAIAPFFLFRSPHTPYRTHCFDIAIPLAPREQAAYSRVLALEMSPAIKMYRLRYATLYPEFPIAPSRKDRAGNEFTVVYSVNDITLNPDADDVGQQISIFKQLVKKSTNEGAIAEFNREPMIHTFTKPEEGDIEAIERVEAEVRDKLRIHGLYPEFDLSNIVHETYSFKSLSNELLEVTTEGDFVSPASLPDSTKLVCIRSILETAQLRGEKVLIFVKMINMLHLIEYVLKHYYQGDPEYRVAVLHGGTKKEDREQIITTFKTTSTYRCLILTSRIGGQGLNFQEASHVIFADLEYNYSETEQAVGRVQRTSQTHPDVYTYRFVTPMTIDSAIASIQDRKRSQNEEIRKVGESKTDDMILQMMTPEQLEALAARQAGEAVYYQTGVDRSTRDNTCTWQRISDMTNFQNMLVEQTKRWVDNVIRAREARPIQMYALHQFSEEQMREAALGTHGARIAPRRPYEPTERDRARKRRRQQAIEKALHDIHQRLARLSHDAAQVNLDPERRSAIAHEEDSHEAQQRGLAQMLDIPPVEEAPPRFHEERKEEEVQPPPSPESDEDLPPLPPVETPPRFHEERKEEEVQPPPSPESDEDLPPLPPAQPEESQRPKKKKKKKDKDKRSRSPTQEASTQKKKKKKDKDKRSRSPTQEASTQNRPRQGQAVVAAGASASVAQGQDALALLLSGNV